MKNDKNLIFHAQLPNDYPSTIAFLNVSMQEILKKLVQKKLPKLSESIRLPSAEIFPILESLVVVALATMSKS